MSKKSEDWCSRVIRDGLSGDAPTADALVALREAPLVWHRLLQCGAAATCESTVASALHQASAARAMESELLNRELRRVFAAAHAAGVRLVAIKGAAVAHTHYPQPHLRPRGDSDLVVAGNDRATLWSVLRGCGYAPAGAVDGALVTRQAQWTYPLGRDLVHTLDVHWEIFNPHAFSGVLSVTELFKRAVPVPALGPSALAPQPVHALLLACVHRVAHHFGDEDVLWLYDIRLLAESLSEPKALEFIALATGRSVAEICARSLEVAQRVVGGRFPGRLQSWIDRGSWPETAERTAGFLAQHRQIDHLLSDLRALPNLHTRLRLVGQHLFPRAEYMLTRYGVRSRLLLPYLYLRRIVEGAPRWFR